MIFESKKEYDELVNEIERELVDAKKEDKLEKRKEDEGPGGKIPFNKIQPPRIGHENGRRSSAWVEDFETRILKILKEKEAVGEIQPVSTLGRNNPRVEYDSTPNKQSRSKADSYGSTRKGKGTPESQKKSFGPQDPIDKLAAELGDSDEAEQDQQGSEEETSQAEI